MEYDSAHNLFRLDEEDREVFGLASRRMTWEADRPEPLYNLVMATNRRLLRRLENGQVKIEELTDEILITQQFRVIKKALEVLRPHLPQVEVIEELETDFINQKGNE